MKYIIVIGPKGTTKEVAEKLSASFNLPIFDAYEFRTNSWKERKPGIYVSHNLLYQQAKKMGPDMICITYDEARQTVYRKATKLYSLVDVNTGETYIMPETGYICDKLTQAAASALKLRINKSPIRETKVKMVEYEKDCK